MLKRVLTLIITALFFSSTVLAQTTTSTVGRFTILKKGEPAPFEGTLFDPLATAKMIVDKQQSEKEFNSKLSFELEKLKLKKDTEILILQTSLTFAEKEKKKIGKLNELQLKETIKVLSPAKLDLTWLWVTLSFIAGVGLTVLGVWGASQLSDRIVIQ